MTCRVGNFDALTYLTVTMRTHTNSFEKVLVGEKSRNRYFFRNAFCMRKDEVYHKIFMLMKTSVKFLPYVTQTIRYYNTVWWRFSLLHILLIQNIAKCSLLLKSFFSNMCFDICNNSCHVLFLPFDAICSAPGALA